MIEKEAPQARDSLLFFSLLLSGQRSEATATSVAKSPNHPQGNSELRTHNSKLISPLRSEIMDAPRLPLPTDVGIPENQVADITITIHIYNGQQETNTRCQDQSL